MKTYPIRITETLSKVVEVEASSWDEALQIANDNYENEAEGYVLTADDFDESEIEEADE